MTGDGAGNARRKSVEERSMRKAKFAFGQVVRHRFYPFRGVVFDIDPVFNNSEDWWLAIPAEIRPSRISRTIICSPRTPRPSTSPMSRSRTCSPDDSGQPLRHPAARRFLRRGRGRALPRRVPAAALTSQLASPLAARPNSEPQQQKSRPGRFPGGSSSCANERAYFFVGGRCLVRRLRCRSCAPSAPGCGGRFFICSALNFS